MDAEGFPSMTTSTTHSILVSTLAGLILLEGFTGCSKGTTGSSSELSQPTASAGQTPDNEGTDGAYLLRPTGMLEKVTVVSAPNEGTDKASGSPKARVRLPTGAEEACTELDIVHLQMGKSAYRAESWHDCPYAVCATQAGHFVVCKRTGAARCQIVEGDDCAGRGWPLIQSPQDICQRVGNVWESITFRRLFDEGVKTLTRPDIPLPKALRRGETTVLGKQEGAWQEGDIVSCNDESCEIRWKQSSVVSSLPWAQLAALPPSREFETSVGRYVAARLSEPSSPIWTVFRVKQIPASGVVVVDASGKQQLFQTAVLVGLSL
jgi:hypothetical protein